MRKFILDETQPFGVVRQTNSMGGMGRPAEHINRPLGNVTMIPNNGADHGPSFADKNPGAHAQACAHYDNPFYWSGRPKGAA